MTYYVFDRQAAKAQGYLDVYTSWFNNQDIDFNRPCKFVGKGERDTLAYFDFTTRKGVVRDHRHMHRAFFRPHVPEPFNESDYL